jgi:hypothetical protein
MTNTKDQMQDIFPVNFNFKLGEQPTAEKLTGFKKQTDAAFNRATAVIGDPQDYNIHTTTDGIEYKLSPEKLSQANMARAIGPIDYVSPEGGCWQEPIGETDTLNVTLASGRNTWSLGFPLVKTGSNIITKSSGVSEVFSTLEFGTDITISNQSSKTWFSGNPKSLLEDVISDGDWHIDYYTGVITSYSYSTSSATFVITNINMLGPGVPWGTSNVIPPWTEASNLCLCTPIKNTEAFKISLPVVDNNTPRFASANSMVVGQGATISNMKVFGETSKYRLPYSIVNNLKADDEIPDNFILLWDESAQRVVPMVSFIYIDEYNIKVTTSANLLSVDRGYRIITIGTSLSEAVGYLLSTTRTNKHDGLTDGPDKDTIRYSIPISHDSLSHLYTGTDNDLPENKNIDRFRFAKSSMPVNPHPQYFYRTGYFDTSTEDGNYNNAMLGSIVLAGQFDTDEDSDTYKKYVLGVGTSSGCMKETYSLCFGGDPGSGLAADNNPKIKFEGGKNIDTWESGVAHRLGFGIDGTGFQSTENAERYGALSVYQYYGMPLYLKGRYVSSETNMPYTSGGSIAFNYGNANEMNYIKLVAGFRDESGTYDSSNLPADTGSGLDFSDELTITPGLSSRISHKQIREFRFRAVPYVSDADNTGLSSSGTEFAKYFTSPAIVGADWFNVYSNAIFFSETGTGKSTSFTIYGRDWLRDEATRPVGIYYTPNNESFDFFTSNPEDNSERGYALKLSKFANTTFYGKNIIIGQDPDSYTDNDPINNISTVEKFTATVKNKIEFSIVNEDTSYQDDSHIGMYSKYSGTGEHAFNLFVKTLSGAEANNIKLNLYNSGGTADDSVYIYSTAGGVTIEGKESYNIKINNKNMFVCLNDSINITGTTGESFNASADEIRLYGPTLSSDLNLFLTKLPTWAQENTLSNCQVLFINTASSDIDLQWKTFKVSLATLKAALALI